MSSPYERVLAEVRARGEDPRSPAPTGPAPLFVPEDVMQFLREAGWTLTHDTQDRNPGSQRWWYSLSIELYLTRGSDGDTPEGELWLSENDCDCMRIKLRMVRYWLRKHGLDKSQKKREEEEHEPSG